MSKERRVNESDAFWFRIRSYVGIILILLGGIFIFAAKYLESSISIDPTSLEGTIIELLLNIGIAFFPIGIITYILENLQKEYYIKAIENSVIKYFNDNIENLTTSMTNRIYDRIMHGLREEKFFIKESTRDMLYILGTEIIQNSSKKLYVLQKTPSLLLGCKPYDKSSKSWFPYEVKFVQELNKWIDDTVNMKNKQCLYLYCKHGTLNDMKTETIKKRVIDSIIEYKDKEIKSNRCFQINSIDPSFSGPMILGDNRFAIWIKGGDKAVCIEYKDEIIANDLSNIIKEMAYPHTNSDDLLHELGLSFR